MATNYPGSIDSLTNPSAGDALTSPSHSAQHANANDAIEAIETELGTNPSGSDATVAARLTAIEAGTNLATGAVTSAKIADGTIATADIADAAVTYAKLGADVRIGNLLTLNQATGTDVGAFAATVSTLSAVADGLQVTSSGNYAGAVVGGPTAQNAGYLPVTGGETYTVTAEVKAASITRPVRMAFRAYTAAGVATGGTITSSSVTLSTSWQKLAQTVTVPSDAAFAHFVVYIDGTSTASEVYTIRRFSLHRGADGVWVPPGVVVPGTSHIAVNGAYTTSGTVAPEGVVTAPPLSRYLQTSGAATVTGAMEWVKATGTGNTGWVAGAEADTGERNINALVTWPSESGDAFGMARVRRVGNMVHVYLRGAIGGTTGATVSSVLTLPTGFRPSTLDGGDGALVWHATRASAGDTDARFILQPDSGVVRVKRIAADASWFGGAVAYMTSDAWPSSLPGSAA